MVLCWGRVFGLHGVLLFVRSGGRTWFSGDSSCEPSGFSGDHQSLVSGGQSSSSGARELAVFGKISSFLLLPVATSYTLGLPGLPE